MAYANYANVICDPATGQVWNIWVTNCTSTTTYSNTAIWQNWCITGTSFSNSITISPDQYAAQQQMMAAQQAAAAEANQRYAEQQVVAQAAKAKSLELLNENITEHQREMLAKNGWFLVEGGKSKKTYKIRNNSCAGNIFELDAAGKEVAKYCVHADHTIPIGDQLLTQALSLAHDEEHIISKANMTRLAA